MPWENIKRKENKNATRDKVSKLDIKQFWAWRNQVHHERKSIIFNNENWGLAKEELSETVINKGIR